MRRNHLCTLNILFINFSSYALPDGEYKALSYGLDHHIPTPCNYNAAETEFELFYQNILSNILHNPENELMQLKSKLRNVCHKYKIKVPYKYQHIIANLINNKTIKVLKQNKGRGVGIMDNYKYKGKCLELLQNDELMITQRNVMRTKFKDSYLN